MLCHILTIECYLIQHTHNGWLVFYAFWGEGTRKAALSDSPVDCRNRRGFAAAKRIRFSSHLRNQWGVTSAVENSFEPISMQLSGGQLLDAGSTASTPYVAPPGATVIESVLPAASSVTHSTKTLFNKEKA